MKPPKRPAGKPRDTAQPAYRTGSHALASPEQSLEQALGAEVRHHRLRLGLTATGLAAQADPGPRLDINMYTYGHTVEARRLPLNLLDALRAFEASAPLREALGGEFADAYVKLRREDWAAYARHLSAWEIETTLDA